uniref:Transmembrane and coiled-coil domain-containing protein 3-like n=1 Tax=Phallusia mammillata TaxID=59560 RepID=A0A6F9DVL4_9ASCI|nr:transmembrane and coiled-coil domain-containing protein 3-like [Phallusia mammillata]
MLNKIALFSLMLLLIQAATCHVIKDMPGRQINKKQNNQNVKQNVQEIIRNLPQDSSKSKQKDLGSLPLRGLSNMKVRMEDKVKQAQAKVNQTKHLSENEKILKLHVLEMYMEELQENERDMIEAEQALRKSLAMDFRNSTTLKANRKKRLDALRMATLKEERSLNRMNEFEIEMKKYMDVTNDSSWMSELLKEISHAADQLQDSVAEDMMSDNEMQRNGAHIEAVVHVMEKNEDNLYPEFEDANMVESEDERLDMLIDSKNNKYILTRQKDATSPFIDHVLVVEIILLLLLSVPLGFMCQLIGVPSLFGYILTGVILGPSGLNVIQEMIQIETIGELGVFMIMFCAGMEFSYERVAKVWKVAVQVPLLTTLFMILAGIVIGSVIMQNTPMRESAFVSACLSLSSTPLVTRFLQSSSKDTFGNEYSALLLGMLVVQDVQLGFIIAILPGFASTKQLGSFGDVFLHVSFIVIKTLCSLGVVVVAMFVIIRYVMPHYSRLIVQQTRELQLLGALFVMYLSQITTSFIGISMELGCFVAGTIIAHSSHLAVIEQKVLAVHDLLSVIFFATIGFHVFPTFVFLELTLLLSLTLIIVAGKYFICLLVLRFVLPVQNRKLKWIVSSGLAQVSEFSFVLGSRARHLKIISREVFLLILSVTTLSLLLAPVIWKLSLWSYRAHHASMHIR